MMIINKSYIVITTCTFNVDRKKCVKKVGFNSYSSHSLIHVASSMYVRKYFDPRSKDATVEMIGFIKKAFKEELLDKARHKLM